MAFKDYNEFPAPRPVEIPINGKTYAFPGRISARAWMLIERISTKMDRLRLAEARGETVDPDEDLLDDFEYVDVKAEMFGDTERELIADGVSSDVIKRLFATLTAYHMGGRQSAEQVWN